MTTGVQINQKIAMEEVVLDDADLKKKVEAWAKAKSQKSALNAKIRELDVDGKKDAVLGKLEWDGDEEVRYRVADTPFVIVAKPAGESKDVAFVTDPKKNITLQEDGA